MSSSVISSAASTQSLSTTPAPTYDTSELNKSQAYDEFVELLGATNIIANSREERVSRSSNAWYPAADQMPSLVLLPESTSDVSKIMQICSRRHIPVTSFSGGTSLPGAVVCTRGGVCVDFARMDRIITVHADDMDVVVQPAVEWQHLNAQLDKQGLFFPPDPGPGARIGGMIAMSCSGTNAYRYGTMKEWVVSMTVVLADGTIVKTRRRPRKTSAGYDLTHLMIGSEGTLGLVTEAVLKVTTTPQNLQVAIATFPSLQAAVKTAISIIKSTAGAPINALELLDTFSMHAINKSSLSSIEWREQPTLFLKFAGPLQSTVKDQIEMARTAAADNGGYDSFVLYSDKHDIKTAWDSRKAVAPAIMAMKQHPTDLFMSADAAVPISRLGDIMDETQRAIKEAGLTGGTLGHVGDGNFHTAIVCPAARKDEVSQLIAEKVQRRAVELDGTVTGEHGIGLGLRDALVHEVGEEAVDMMRRIKLALDPLCILNPDKVVRLEEGR